MAQPSGKVALNDRALGSKCPVYISASNRRLSICLYSLPDKDGEPNHQIIGIKRTFEYDDDGKKNTTMDYEYDADGNNKDNSGSGNSKNTSGEFSSDRSGWGCIWL